jgi:hypothetical protein
LRHDLAAYRIFDAHERSQGVSAPIVELTFPAGNEVAYVVDRIHSHLDVAMKLTPENLDYEDCRPGPPKTKIQLSDRLAQILKKDAEKAASKKALDAKRTSMESSGK